MINLAVLWPTLGLAALIAVTTYTLWGADFQSDPQPDPLEECVEPQPEPCQAVQEELPLRANATVKTYPWAHGMSESLTRSYNSRPWLDTETASLIRPTRKIWIYNVSRMAHVVNHPFLGANSRIPANDTKKRYVTWTSLPDIINPDNLSLDQTREGKEGVSVMSIGRNLGVRGVFWSNHNPPRKVEVDAAIERMEKHYLKLLEQAKAVEESGNYRELVQMITPEHRAAADWFKIATLWHVILPTK